MDKELQQLILKWILDNHEHHSHYIPNEYDDEQCDCEDGDYPYVNSLKLEEFIKTL